MTTIRRQQTNVALSNLPDVDFTTPPTDGQVLQYNATQQRWLPATSSGGGGSGVNGVTYTQGNPSPGEYDQTLTIPSLTGVTAARVVLLKAPQDNFVQVPMTVAMPNGTVNGQTLEMMVYFGPDVDQTLELGAAPYRVVFSGNIAKPLTFSGVEFRFPFTAAKLHWLWWNGFWYVGSAEQQIEIPVVANNPAVLSGASLVNLSADPGNNTIWRSTVTGLPPQSANKMVLVVFLYSQGTQTNEQLPGFNYAEFGDAGLFTTSLPMTFTTGSNPAHVVMVVGSAVYDGITGDNLRLHFFSPPASDFEATAKVYVFDNISDGSASSGGTSQPIVEFSNNDEPPAAEITIPGGSFSAFTAGDLAVTVGVRNEIYGIPQQNLVNTAFGWVNDVPTNFSSKHTISNFAWSGVAATVAYQTVDHPRSVVSTWVSEGNTLTNDTPFRFTGVLIRFSKS